jgi:hypothetical protein
MNHDRVLERARRYLAKRDGLPQYRLVCGDRAGVRQAVVIPVLAEERLLYNTLASLGRSSMHELEETLVICVVNNRAKPHATTDQIADNQRTLSNLDRLMHGESADTDPPVKPGRMRLAYVDASSPGRELAPNMGVGEARRIGLDHALSVLTTNSEAHGLLFSLDADTLVASDYLQQVRAHFQAHSSWAAVVRYAHCLPPGRTERRAIALYELFLRYHELGLRYAGSPYAFATIGSTMVARCDAYVAAGGMNRRQAGEDFYFLQQLAKTGGVSRINSTSVHPSPRPSSRVPFGTGASIARFLSGEIDGATVYHPGSYKILDDWLSLAVGGLDLGAQDLLHQAAVISPLLMEFLQANNFEKIWPRLQHNAPDRTRLEAQLHRWFDGFKTLKLIHFLRDRQHSQHPIFDAIRELLEWSDLQPSNIAWSRITNDPDMQVDLLDHLRRVCATND